MVPIIIVDDSREDSLLAQRVIKEAGFLNPITTFSNPAQLISYFVQAGESAPSVLVFLDLVMIPWNGIELLNLLKAYSLFSRSVFVMVTGLGDVRHIQPAYNAGAVTFLMKPFTRGDFDNFLKAFDRLFSTTATPAGKELHWADASRAASRAPKSPQSISDTAQP